MQVEYMYMYVLQQFSNFRLQQHQLFEPIRQQNSNPSAIRLDGTVLTLCNWMVKEVGKMLYTGKMRVGYRR